MKTIDIICIGEILVDYISKETNVTVHDGTDFKCFLGGSPTNVAVNAATLGLQALLVATYGNDDLGKFVQQELQNIPLNRAALRRSENYPTSKILISRSTETPDFKAFRDADCRIKKSQLPETLVQSARIFHTTCFALSKNPARETILLKAQQAAAAGLTLSIDINYSEKIWPDRVAAATAIASYLAHKPLVKISDDDCLRFFNEVKSDDAIFDYFHKLGASTICLTKGSDGVVVSNKVDKPLFFEALYVENIIDTTGAGDAFWTGFLYGYLKQDNLETCVSIAQNLAAIKLQTLGRLPSDFSIESLYS